MPRSFAVKVCSVPLVSERSTVWMGLLAPPAHTVHPQGEVAPPPATAQMSFGKPAQAPTVQVAPVAAASAMPAQLAVPATHAGIWFQVPAQPATGAAPLMVRTVVPVYVVVLAFT